MFKGKVVKAVKVKGAVTFLPRAANQLTATTDASGGAAVWTATGNDPHFHLVGAAGEPVDLKGGWYLLRIVAEEVSGQLDSPRLYMDYGVGFSEAFTFPLDSMRTSNGFAGLIRLEQPVTGLRFDPSVSPCEFSLKSISLQRLSKGTAAWFMYRSLARREKDPINLFRKSLAEYRRDGSRTLGDWLYNRYAPHIKPDVRDYAEWIAKHDTVGENDVRAMRQQSALLAHKPVISVVMPVYNTAEGWLRRCMDSVLRQGYPYWELCVADDASTAPHVKKVLNEYAAKDRRIKVVFREKNGHISEASNSALALATGEWIALLDHDDELPPHALYMVVMAIAERPDARMIYSDEDKIDEDGKRFDPYFKPDWNPDLFYSQNMITHLGVYSASLIKKIGGFREGFEGAQDYDLALRCIEELKAAQIIHIPRVLYHWRAIEGSTALAIGEKSYAVLAGVKALEDHFFRTGVKGVSVEIVDNGYRILRAIDEKRQPSVSLIIPTRDRVDLLRMCISSILEKTTYENYVIVVVDNQSIEPATHEYFDSIKKHPKVRIVEYDEPFNYSSMNNVAVASTESDIVGLINNDIEVIHGDWLHEMVSQAVREDIGAVGAMLYYPNNTIQHAGVTLGIGGVAGHSYVGKSKGFGGQMSRALLIQNLSAVTAACLLIRREVFNSVGGLDPRLQVAFNDVDFCIRVRNAGLRNLWTPYAELYHHESASRGYEDTPAKHERFMREVVFMGENWGDVLQKDPAYNPNLTLQTTDFELATQPRLAPLHRVLARESSVLPY